MITALVQNTFTLDCMSPTAEISNKGLRGASQQPFQVNGRNHVMESGRLRFVHAPPTLVFPDLSPVVADTKPGVFFK